MHKNVNSALILAIALQAACGESECQAEACDILDEDCQLELFDFAMCSSGMSGPAPFIRVLSEAEYVEELHGNEPPELAAERDREFFRWNNGLALVNMAPRDLHRRDAIGSFATGVGASYGASSATVRIIDRGAPTDSAAAVEVLVHEFVHALQDTTYDLSSYVEHHFTTHDASLAATAIIEGEATLHTGFAHADLEGWADIDWGFPLWQEEMRQTAIRETSPWLISNLLFPYAYGTERAHSAWQSQGVDGVSILHEAIPHGTRDFLVATGPRVQPASLAHRVARPPPDYALSDHTALGAWLFDVFVQRIGAGDLAAFPIADNFMTYAHNTAESYLSIWRVRFENAALASSARVEAMFPDTLEVRLDGTDLLIVGADDTALQTLNLEWIDVETIVPGNSGTRAASSERRFHRHGAESMAQLPRRSSRRPAWRRSAGTPSIP